MSFVSPAGFELLANLRVGSAPGVTGGRAPVEMLACVPSEECGCPEEVWRIDGIQALIHFEADGMCDMFLFAGDWEAERNVAAQDMADLRAQMFAWIASLNKEGS